MNAKIQIKEPGRRKPTKKQRRSNGEYSSGAPMDLVGIRLIRKVAINIDPCYPCQVLEFFTEPFSSLDSILLLLLLLLLLLFFFLPA